MRERNALENLGVVFLTHHHCGFDLIDAEIPAAPDHVTVAPAPDAGLRSGTAFGLPLATRGFDLLEELDAVPLFLEPVDPVSRDVGIHNDTAASLPGPDDDYPELIPKFGQMTPIASGNGDVEYGHLSASILPKALPQSPGL